jgi:DNA polymerase-3 subunit delta
MAAYRYEALDKILRGIAKGGAVPVYLLHGDEFLYKASFKRLLDALVPRDQKDLNYEPIDGETVSLDEVVARLNTFPLFPGEKVIALHDTKLFYSRATSDQLLMRAKAAFERDDWEEAARHFLRMLSICDLTLDDLAHDDGQSRLGLKKTESDKKMREEWVGRLVEYCLGQQLRPPVHGGEGDQLSEAIRSGFPETNHLVITAEFVDRRRKLYKTIEEAGVIIDCSVSKGDRAADKRQQREALWGCMEEALTQAEKTMAPGAFEALYEKTGSALRSFNNELNKIITFVGDRKVILAEDVEKASQKTKEDPIYELTNAIGQRELGKALGLIDSLLRADYFPLQVLAAAANYVRRMLLARDLIQGVLRTYWNSGMNYGTFQRTVWGHLSRAEGGHPESKMHPFVVYKTLVHSENYTCHGLAKALEVLLGADIRLKTTGQDAKLVLEHAIMEVCGASADPFSGSEKGDIP